MIAMAEPRILLFDIESLPDMDMVMNHLPSMSDYPGLTLKASINSVICFGYKWYGEGKTHCLNAWDYKGWAKNVNDDSQLVKAASEIISTADCVVTHNGKRFDWKFIQTRLLKHNLPPLPKIAHVDTCAEAKRNLLMFQNRLNTVAKFLTKSEKLENGGWDLWARVMKRDDDAMALMSKYCKQDVNVLSEVFKRLRPFCNQIPNYNMYNEVDTDVCPNCGSTRIQKSGVRANKNAIRQRYRCLDCGTSCSSRKEGHSPNTL
jgi:DNA polymerase elongation subunit (family B)